MVQGFPELDRINQSMAFDIGFVMFMQVVADKHEGRDLFTVVSEPDVRQIAAHAHKECTSKNIRGLKAGCFQ